MLMRRLSQASITLTLDFLGATNAVKPLFTDDQGEEIRPLFEGAA